MKWLSKLQENNIQESKLGKRITAKIVEFKQLDAEIKQLEANKGQVPAEDLEEFNSDLAQLKTELADADAIICVDIDKYIANIPVMAEKVKKMQDARKAKGGQAPAPKPAQQQQQAPTQQQAAAPTQQQAPAQQQVAANGGQVAEKKEGTNWGKWILGGALVLLTGGAAYNYFKNK